MLRVREGRPLREIARVRVEDAMALHTVRPAADSLWIIPPNVTMTARIIVARLAQSGPAGAIVLYFRAYF